MAVAESSRFKPCDELSFESWFSYDLLIYVLTQYDLIALSTDTLGYKNYSFISKHIDLLKNFNNEKNREPNKNESRRIKRIAYNEPPSPFCLHIGEAILVLSHLNRIYFKLRFDAIFPTLKGSAEIEPFCFDFARKHFKNGYLSEFLFVYAFMMELVVYLALREEMLYTTTIWHCFDLIYSSILKDKFLERGGWKELKKASRPWWHCYRKAKANGISLSNPEWVYFNQQLAAEPLSRYPFVGGGNYIDEGHPDDLPEPPKRIPRCKSPEEEHKLACSTDACLYFLLVREHPDRSGMTESVNVASASLVTCSEGSEQASSHSVFEQSGQTPDITEVTFAPSRWSSLSPFWSSLLKTRYIPTFATSGGSGQVSAETVPRATASQDIAVRTPEVDNYTEPAVVPPDYLPRSRITDVYISAVYADKRRMSEQIKSGKVRRICL